MNKVNFLIGTLSSGGAERVVSNLSLNLDSNIEKNIILFGKDQKIVYDYSGNIVSLDHNSTKNLFDKITTLITRLKVLRKIKKNTEGPTISFLEYPNILNILTKNSGETIISVRNHMSRKHQKGLKSYFWKMSIKHLYKYADKIIVVSKEIQEDLIVNFGIDESKIKLIYNSYPIEVIKRKSLENDYFNNLKFEHKQKFICTVGRLNVQKGHVHLLKAFSKVLKSNSDIKLVIIGEGPLKSDLVIHAKKLNIDHAVVFVDFIDNPFEIISKSQLFVLSSLYEGFPNALLEAMICGVPVISTNCPSGPQEILLKDKKKYGFLVSRLDSEKFEMENLELTNAENEMADGIERLLKDEKLQYEYKKKSIERSNDFDIKEIIKKWEELI